MAVHKKPLQQLEVTFRPGRLDRNKRHHSLILNRDPLSCP